MYFDHYITGIEEENNYIWMRCPYFLSKVYTHVNAVHPVTHGTEGTVTGDIIEQHHLVTEIKHI